MNTQEYEQMHALIERVRNLIKSGKYAQAQLEAAQAMACCPHAAQPHNLMGIILERKNDHAGAMKHFRAAWALDPGYLPARVNMDRYGCLSMTLPRPAYDDDDCPEEVCTRRKVIVCDKNGVEHIVRRHSHGAN